MRLEKTLAEDPHHPDAAPLRAALARYRLARRLARRLAARLAVGAVALTVIAAPPARAQDRPAHFAELPALQTISGGAVAMDGDTLEFRDRGVRVRLHAVGAPEMSEWPWGPFARATVDRWVNAQVVTCRPTGAESRGRPVAICGTASIPDIGQALIAAGLATEHRAYSGTGLIAEAYRNAEFTARHNGRGVWFGWTPPDAD